MPEAVPSEKLPTLEGREGGREGGGEWDVGGAGVEVRRELNCLIKYNRSHASGETQANELGD